MLFLVKYRAVGEMEHPEGTPTVAVVIAESLDQAKGAVALRESNDPLGGSQVEDFRVVELENLPPRVLVYAQDRWIETGLTEFL